MNWLVYLCYPLMLLFLLFGSKWHGRGQWNEVFFHWSRPSTGKDSLLYVSFCTMWRKGSVLPR